MIPIVKEPGSFSLLELERCCFCRDKTPHWTNIKSRKTGEQVACCEDCSEVYLVKDVPTKRYWFEKEQQISELPEKALPTPRHTKDQREFNE